LQLKLLNYWLNKLFPVLRWWPKVKKETVRADLMAGLTGTIILLPQAVAYAIIAGLPPEYGLYTAIVPVIISALFGSSWHLVSGPTAAISIVVFATISPLAEPGTASYINLVMTLTFLVGIFKLALGVARMGVLVNFISHSVVIGFTAGAGILIAVSQLKNFFGVHIPVGGSFYHTLFLFVQQFRFFNPFAVSVGLVTLLSGFLAKKYVPKIPYMITAMLVGSLSALTLKWLFGPSIEVETVTAIPRSLPPLSHPEFSADAFHKLAAIALAVTMLSLTEALSIARAVALKSGQRIDGNQEFVGQGLANILGSFSSGYVSSGSFTRSGINYSAGAKTPLASVFSAGLLVVTLLLFAPLAGYLPIASMAALLFMVAYSLIEIRHIKIITTTSHSESAVLFTTLFATLFLELQFAIYVGVILSLILFLERTARPTVRDAVPAADEGSYHFVPQNNQPDCCQLKMVFIDGAIYFGAVNHVQQTLHRIDELNPTQKHVLILAPGINFIDIAGAELLAQEAKRRKLMGGGLYFHRLKEPVVDTLTKGGYLDEIGRENLLTMGQNVIDAIYPKLDSNICRNCPTRIFKQCHVALPNGEPR
jgi:SulP family sulfate permease